jgi:hypothetical protein
MSTKRTWNTGWFADVHCIQNMQMSGKYYDLHNTVQYVTLFSHYYYYCTTITTITTQYYYIVPH